jgi:hypothetical protein
VRAAEWTEVAAAIDERVHYVGPVLEGILHLEEHQTSHWDLRG